MSWACRRRTLAVDVPPVRPIGQTEEVVEYVTSWERKGLEERRQEGRQEGALEALHAVLPDVLVSRFGAAGESLQTRIGRIDSIAELRMLTHRALTADSLNELGL